VVLSLVYSLLLAALLYTTVMIYTLYPLFFNLVQWILVMWNNNTQVFSLSEAGVHHIVSSALLRANGSKGSLARDMTTWLR